MGVKGKQLRLRQKAEFEQQLKDRRSFLSGKGIEPPKADKDPLVKKLKADIKTMNSRLKLIDDTDKKMEDMAKTKAERAAARLKEKESGKTEKPKKVPEEVKDKKKKAEKKAAPPKAPEGGQSQTPAGPPEEGKATTKK